MDTTLGRSLEKFVNGYNGFKSSLEDVLASIDSEKESLRQKREELEQEKEAFRDEQERVAQVVARADEQVTLNVGGYKYTTTVTTLRNAPAPSLFNAMFSGRHNLEPDENGCFFLDRDGRHFHDILNFLRDGSFSYPEDGADFKYLLELRSEAEYYCLTGLVEQIDRFPYSLTRVRRAVSVNTAEGWVYANSVPPAPDEIIINVSAPCQLMGVGLCGTERAFTVVLKVSEVDPEDFSWDARHLGGASQSFTKAESHRMLLPKPILLQPTHFYMISAVIKGSQSSCCEDCLPSVVAAGIQVNFHVWESPNGTSEARGQFPELYIRTINPPGS